MFKRPLFSGALALLTAVGFAGTSRANVQFNFDDQATYSQSTSTPFSITASGLTATFRAKDGSDVYSVYPASLNGYHALTGNVLEAVPPPPVFNPAPAVTPLVVQFSQPIKWLSLNYAYDDQGQDNVTFRAYSGGTSGTAVGSALVLSGAVPDGAVFPEGAVTFSPGKPGTTFDTIVLSTNAPALALDNLVVTLASETPPPPPKTTPEPSGLVLMGLGVICAAAAARRRAS